MRMPAPMICVKKAVCNETPTVADSMKAINRSLLESGGVLVYAKSTVRDDIFWDHMCLEARA